MMWLYQIFSKSSNLTCPVLYAFIPENSLFFGKLMYLFRYTALLHISTSMQAPFIVDCN